MLLHNPFSQHVFKGHVATLILPGREQKGGTAPTGMKQGNDEIDENVLGAGVVGVVDGGCQTSGRPCIVPVVLGT